MLKSYAIKTVAKWSAGGVVAQTNASGKVEIALVFRKSEDLWALPKGGPDDGESVERTALREVHEETGLDVNLISSIDETRYTFIKSKYNRKKKKKVVDDSSGKLRVRKTVYWYLMEPTGGDFANHDHEYDEVRWVELDDAVSHLKHASEAKVARKAVGMFVRWRNAPDLFRLRGERAVVRSKRRSDAWPDYLWRTDTELSRLDATRPMTTSFHDFEEYFSEELRRPSSKSLRFAIEDENGAYIGNCMCYDINKGLKQAEFGIMIGDSRYWDQGYGSDATRTVISHVFATTDIRRLYLHTLKSNGRAQRCFANVGFRPCGEVRRDGFDFVKMEIFAKDWNESKD